MKLFDVFAIARDAEIAGDGRFVVILVEAGPAAGFYRWLYAQQRTLPMTDTEERLFASHRLVALGAKHVKDADTFPLEFMRAAERASANASIAIGLELVDKYTAMLAIGNVGERSPVHGPRIPKPRKRRRRQR